VRLSGASQNSSSIEIVMQRGGLVILVDDEMILAAVLAVPQRYIP
jgi:hypothetical protein